ncbi:MAG: hypothetical protein E7645_04015 [Ruminococcaceae bacterium]|nr:hypothetical protein [Oscillospiraceae bacterium]
MKNSPANQRGLLFLIGLIILAIYNVVVFVCFGFADHGPTFWISYGGMMLGALVAAFGISRFSTKNTIVIDWFFGYPVIRLTYIYVILELIVSTIFLILDKQVSWTLPLVIQVILLGIYLIFILSCLFSRNASTQVVENLKSKTANIKLLSADAQMLVEMAKSPEAQKQFKALAEEIHFSDPMSSDALEPLEHQIGNCLTDAKMLLSEGDEEGAMKSANRALFLVKERAMKCKILK